VSKEYRVVSVNIPAKQIFGMVGRCGGGHNSVWTDWSPVGRVKRKKIIAQPMITNYEISNLLVL